MRYLILGILMMACTGMLFAGTPGDRAGNGTPHVVETVWGPDAFGYIAKDSNEPDGPVVDWIDISTIGTVVNGLGDDNIVGGFDIGFPFRYYWYDVTTFAIGSNGYIRFSGAGQLSDPFTVIPNPVAPNDVVCPYAADFDPTSGGTVYYWTNNTDSLVVSYVGVPAWNTGGSHDFQLLLTMTDTSITFNYGTQSGTFSTGNGVVGIENSAGDIGIMNISGNAVPSNYAIKFFYPDSITFAVHDVGVTDVHNDNSGGFFLERDAVLETNGNFKNFGNQDEYAFNAIAQVRQYPSNTVVFSDSLFIDSLLAGEEIFVEFTDTWTASTAGNYYVRGLTDLAGDLVPSNNQKDVELRVVELPGLLTLDDGTSENVWSWNGGNGGMGVYYLPPTYPVKVTDIRAFLGSGTLPTLLQLYDDDGLDGQPGTLLSSTELVAPTQTTYTVNLADSNIVVTEGGVYVAWLMTGVGSSGLGIDGNSIGSRQTWEYTGVWAEFRNFATDDAMLRISLDDNVVDIGNKTTVPGRFALNANYPNPFNPTTKITYEIPRESKVQLRVFNVLGQEIRTLVSEVQGAGKQTITWDGKNNAGQVVSSGVYVYRLEAGSFVKARKMMLMK